MAEETLQGIQHDIALWESQIVPSIEVAVACGWRTRNRKAAETLLWPTHPIIQIHYPTDTGLNVHATIIFNARSPVHSVCLHYYRAFAMAAAGGGQYRGRSTAGAWWLPPSIT
jgi:Zn ribbon nucleic-acid-binding protein